MCSQRAVVLFIGLVGSLSMGCFQTAFAQSSKACALFSAANVSSAVGMSVGEGGAIGSTGCRWSGGGVTATLTVSDAGGWQMMKTPLPGVAKSAAHGIGDDAFYTTVATLTTLSVKKGNTVFVVRLYGVAGKSRQIAVEKTLAGDVLGKL